MRGQHGWRGSGWVKNRLRLVVSLGIAVGTIWLLCTGCTPHGTRSTSPTDYATSAAPALSNVVPPASPTSVAPLSASLAAPIVAASLTSVASVAVPPPIPVSRTPVVVVPPIVVAGPKVYQNCAALNVDYPHGVGRTGAIDHVSSGKPVTDFVVNDAVYQANPNRDGDNDGIACEKH